MSFCLSLWQLHQKAFTYGEIAIFLYHIFLQSLPGVHATPQAHNQFMLHLSDMIYVEVSSRQLWVYTIQVYTPSINQYINVFLLKSSDETSLS